MGRRVDAVVAGRYGWRRADAEVDLAGSRRADHLHDLAARGPSNHRIVAEDDPLPRQQLPDGVQLDLDAEVPDRLLGLDEGPSHVVVADQTELEGNARLLGVAQGGRDARIRNRDHNVRVDGGFTGQPPAHPVAGSVDTLSEDAAVRPAEIDLLEDAEGVARRVGLPKGVERTVLDSQDLARFHIPQVACPDQVEGAGFGGDHVGFLQLAQAERSHAHGVPDGVNAIRTLQQHGVGAPEDPEDLQQGVVQILLGTMGQKMENDFGVAGGLEDGPFRFQAPSQRPGVDDVPVVGQGDGSAPGLGDDGLGVGQQALAHGGVSDVGRGRQAGQPFQLLVVEDLGDVAHSPFLVQPCPVGRDDPGRLLASMLEGIESQIGVAGRLWVSGDAEDAALVVKLVLVHGLSRFGRVRAEAGLHGENIFPCGRQINTEGEESGKR